MPTTTARSSPSRNLPWSSRRHWIAALRNDKKCLLEPNCDNIDYYYVHDYDHLHGIINRTEKDSTALLSTTNAKSNKPTEILHQNLQQNYTLNVCWSRNVPLAWCRAPGYQEEGISYEESFSNLLTGFVVSRPISSTVYLELGSGTHSTGNPLVCSTPK